MSSLDAPSSLSSTLAHPQSDGGSNPQLRAKILSMFKVRGLSLRTDALKILQSALGGVDQSDWDHSLSVVLRALERQSLPSSVIDGQAMRQVVESISVESALVPGASLLVSDALRDAAFGRGSDASSSGPPASKAAARPSVSGAASLRLLQVIDAFAVPKFKYSIDRKTFSLSGTTPLLNAGPGEKASMYRDRYELLKQRILRNPLFRPPIVVNHVASTGEESELDYYKLTPLDSLLGSNEKELEGICTFGMLTQLEEGKYFLEDMSSSIELDLSSAIPATGLFTENCFVLIEGQVVGKKLAVRSIGFPPPEPRDTWRKQFAAINFFGGVLNTQDLPRLKDIEKENPDAMFVILSDVWLDVPKVLEKLRVLFTGYASSPPVAFIMIGNFMSVQYGNNHASIFKQSFEALGKLISEFPQIHRESRFVFVPGNNDPGPGNILPRPALPATLTAPFQKLVPNSVFGSNPCRIRFCSQEIVVFREDIVSKMRRNCILPPNDSSLDLSKHLVKTLLDQAHLCPLPLHVRPVYWDFDQALRLYPLPDALIVADKYDPFNIAYEHCQCINPGSFLSTSFSFMVYYPATREADFSKIDFALV